MQTHFSWTQVSLIKGTILTLKASARHLIGLKTFWDKNHYCRKKNPVYGLNWYYLCQLQISKSKCKWHATNTRDQILYHWLQPRVMQASLWKTEAHSGIFMCKKRKKADKLRVIKKNQGRVSDLTQWRVKIVLCVLFISSNWILKQCDYHLHFLIWRRNIFHVFEKYYGISMFCTLCKCSRS